jgi:hypothetical protein
MEMQMKRLSALLIGVVMIVGAQTTFGLEGSNYQDPSMISGIASTQPWGHDKVEGTNCSNVLIGMDSQGGSADGFKIQQVCLRDEVQGDRGNAYEFGNGGM